MFFHIRRIENVYLRMTEFGRPEVTLCCSRDVKIQ